MEITYYDRLNFAFEQFEQKKLSSSAQLLYLHILHIDNCLGRTGQVNCSDTLISERTGLSPNTVTAAKRALKNYGLLDFKSNKKNPRAGTLYILPQINTRNFAVKTEVNTEVIGGVKGGVKGGVNTGVISLKYTEPVCAKEREKEGEKEIFPQEKKDARARSKLQDNAKKEVSVEVKEKWRKVSAELDEEVRHAWIQANGENPFGGDVQDLLTRQQRYGAKVVANAITACRQKRTFGDRVNIRYLDSELLKGGESRAGNSDLNPTAKFDLWDERSNQLPPS